ncbi:hypothetical protein RGQ29_032517 [Quercus rubra]|uniref:Uncharacterized protein n=1 Tax=Quercus rubra TaxID=3512 RepID=A0AAN7HT00_QUERU|nr:hypothetical protein RGQ29_032517 [Quercus rubra]
MASRSTTENDVDEIHKSNGKLYQALLNEEAQEVINMCNGLEDHALHELTIQKDTVLHKATYLKQAYLVLKLLEDLPACHLDKMTSTNQTGKTILHEEATLDQAYSVDIAREMLNRAWGVGETALFWAARYGKIQIFNFLANEIQPFFQRNDKTTILHIAILAQHLDLALEIATRFRYLVSQRDEDGMTALQLLSCNPKAFERVRRRGFLKRISFKMCGSSGEENEFLKEKLSRESALELAKLLVKKDTSWEVTSSGIDRSKLTQHKYGSTSNESNPLQQQVPIGEITPLFLATKSGCIEIVKEILKIFPQAVEHIDNEGRTILHVAIKYRQLEVFDLVLKMEVAMRWLVRRLDNDENSILHMVGIKRYDYVPEKMRGPALELQ